MNFAKTYLTRCIRKLLFIRCKWVLMDKTLFFAKMNVLNCYIVFEYVSAYKINIYIIKY